MKIKHFPRCTSPTALAIIFLLFVHVSFSQANRETLTNAKIVELVRLGFSEATIITKIRQSNCQCDTSTAAMGKLKIAKVSEAIIMAMLDASVSTEPASKPQFSETIINVPSQTPTNPPEPLVVPTVTAGPAALSQIKEPGIYLFDDGKMQSIEPSVFSGTKMSVWKSAITSGIMKSKWRSKVRGKAANMQAATLQPSFYFVFSPEYKNSAATMAGGLWWGMPATSPAEFVLVQMDVKKASREAVMGEYGLFSGMSTGAQDKDIREYSFEKIKTGVYKVTPKSNLQPGEYCFYFAGNVVGLGFAGGKVFDFSIKTSIGYVK